MSEAGKPGAVARRLVAAAMGLVAVMLAAVTVRQVATDAAATRRLGDVIRKLDEADPGWRLPDLDAARPPVADTENAALLIDRVWRSRHRFTLQGVPSYVKRPPRRPMTAEERDELEEYVRENADDFDDLRPLAAMPKWGYPAATSLAALLREHLGRCSSYPVSHRLMADSVRQAQDRKPSEALARCRAMVNAARAVGDDPSQDSCTTHVHCLSAAGNGIEMCLWLAPADEADLQVLARQLADEEQNSWLLEGRRRRRGAAHLLLDGVASGRITYDDLGIPQRSGTVWHRLTTRSMASHMRQEHADMLAWLTWAVEVARLPLHEQAAEERALEAALYKMDVVRTIPLASFDHEPTKSGDAYRRYMAAVRCLRGLVAVERHSLAHGTWPKALDELVPRLLDRVPLDPFDGEQLRYAIQGDEVVIYSVGPDRAGSGKVVPSAANAGKGVDYGYRLRPRDQRPLQPEKAK